MRGQAKTSAQPKTHANHISAWPTLGKREVGSHGCFSQACQTQSDKQCSLCSRYFPHQAKIETQFLPSSILHLLGIERRLSSLIVHSQLAPTVLRAQTCMAASCGTRCTGRVCEYTHVCRKAQRSHHYIFHCFTAGRFNAELAAISYSVRGMAASQV